MKVLIIGAGAREHAISTTYEKSEKVDSIIISPGNDFIAWQRKKRVLVDKDCNLKDAESILKVAQRHKPDLIDVAQDDALASGATDLLRKNGFLVFGPSKSAARIEWDKKWSRDFMLKNGIPLPEYKSFNSQDDALVYIKEIYSKIPQKLLYIKATGLCAGKGALKAENLSQALQAISQMKEFGKAGETFLIEEGLVGEEFSFYAISDGKSFKIFKSAQDNKTIYNFDQGDQTGGIGAISPVSITTPISNEIIEKQILRVITGMQKEGIPYTGILYLGGIANNGHTNTIEYNARWGDLECQTILPGIQNDYLDIVLACVNSKLNEINIVEDDKTRVCVVGCAKGYPGDYSPVKGKRIFGIEEVTRLPGIRFYSAGISVKDGKFYANGGRLFSVVAEGKDIIKAKERAYAAIAKIHIEGNNLHYRTDIGWREVERFLANTKV